MQSRHLVYCLLVGVWTGPAILEASVVLSQATYLQPCSWAYRLEEILTQVKKEYICREVHRSIDCVAGRLKHKRCVHHLRMDSKNGMNVHMEDLKIVDKINRMRFIAHH